MTAMNVFAATPGPRHLTLRAGGQLFSVAKIIEHAVHDFLEVIGAGERPPGGWSCGIRTVRLVRRGESQFQARWDTCRWAGTLALHACRAWIAVPWGGERPRETGLALFGTIGSMNGLICGPSGSQVLRRWNTFMEVMDPQPPSECGDSSPLWLSSAPATGLHPQQEPWKAATSRRTPKDVNYRDCGLLKG